jgi:hypothetical protein
LSYVIFPTPEMEAASKTRAGLRSRWTENHKRLAFELADAGITQREIALRVCGEARYRTTVQMWLRDRLLSERAILRVTPGGARGEHQRHICSRLIRMVEPTWLNEDPGKAHTGFEPVPPP